MKRNNLKLTVVSLMALPVAMFWFSGPDVSKAAPAPDDDIATFYKTKCAMCHTAKAEKAFRTEETDENLVKAILDGKKGEKPPFMPAYKDKGVDEAKALALVKHMRELRTPAQ